MPDNPQEKRFHGKLLLFGEYGVVIGGRGLTIPLRTVSATLKKRKQEAGTASNQSLRKFHDALNRDPSFTGRLDMTLWNKDLSDGLYLDSDIPQQYGTGSSGALVAAIYQAYGSDLPPRSPAGLISRGSMLREYFAQMESWFHGKSSGLDPLCSYFDTALLSNAGEGIQPAVIPEAAEDNRISLLLVDTGYPAETAPLVNRFLENMKKPVYRRKTEHGYLSFTEQAISVLLDKGISQELLEPLHEVSAVQYDLFSEMIPEHLKSLWLRGLHYGEFVIKLLGSGGGGYFLLFTRDPERTTALFRQAGPFRVYHA